MEQGEARLQLGRGRVFSALLVPASTTHLTHVQSLPRRILPGL